MPHIEKKAVVPAEPLRVFAALTERANTPKWVPNLVRVWDIKPAKAGLGQKWRWEFRILGLSFKGAAEMIGFEAGKECKFRTSGKLESTWTYTVRPNPKGCEVTVAVDYDLPDTLWAKIFDRVAFSRINESQAEQLLVNFRAQFV